MEVGREFSSWECFQNALDQYSQENKVIYIVGTCKPVETANKNELLHNKFPVKFKYCFARMVCKHFGSYSTKSMGQRPNQRTCKTGCTSSIMVSVNSQRTGLVIKEANLQHSHAISDCIFNGYSQTRRLQGDERLMASVLLRAGVPLLRVQEFISLACHKDPTLKDLQNLRSNTLKAKGPSTSTSYGVGAEEFAFLSDVDKLMAEDSGSIVEIINFDLIPGAIYIQTSSMIQSTKTLGSGMLQVITHSINEGKISIVSIVGVDGNQDPHVFALCVIMVISDSALRCFYEAFVRNNTEFCDSVKGIVLDCSKENAEFLQQLIPQAHVAWSQTYVLRALAEQAKSVSCDAEKHLHMFKELMNAETEELYKQNLQSLMASIKSSDYQDFLRIWDATKHLWAVHEVSATPFLHHQSSSIDMFYISMMQAFLNAHMTSSELIRALLRFIRNETPGECDVEKSSSLEIDPSLKLYRQLCFPAAYHAIEGQIMLSLNSIYEIKQDPEVFFVKRKDAEKEYIIDIPVPKCSCPYFQKENLPCEHIFAWLKFSGKSLFDESLIPLKWQVFGTAITLDAIAESLAQGQVPSSFEHDERIKELQIVLRDILALTCTHSYQQMARDLALLRQVLVLMKTCSSYDAEVVLKDACLPSANILSPGVDPDSLKGGLSTASNSACKPSGPPKKRGRGRPSNKERRLRMMQEDETKSAPEQYSQSAKKSKLEDVCSVIPSKSPRHNLRRHIKHMFVTRDASNKAGSTAAAAAANTSDVYVGNEELVPECGISVVQLEEDDSKVVTSVLNEEHTEIYRSVRPKALLKVDNSPSHSGAVHNDLLLVKTSDSEKVEHNANKNHFTPAPPEGKKHQSLDRGLAETKKQHMHTGRRPHVVSDCDDEEETSDDDLEAAESDEDSSDHETFEVNSQRRKEELARFMGEFSNDLLSEVLQNVSMTDTVEEEEKQGSNSDGKQETQHSPEELNSYKESLEVDFVSSCLSSSCPGFEKRSYQVAAALFCKADVLQISATSLLHSLSFWSNHLSDFSVSRPFEGELALNPGQTLTLCGHKLDHEDINSLRPGREISSKTVHAYLEILAQKHSGKMFVLPFSVIQAWRSGAYTDVLFKKVFFKTFDYLVLPIHCGGEFTQSDDREMGPVMQPCWMALVANMKARTVSVLNPRTEDCYAIAANGYSLQWRRYMQIRSIHTREMLSAWTVKHIECNKIYKEGCSATMLLMNVEALIYDVHPSVMQPMNHSTCFRHHVAACLRDMDWQTTVLCVGGPECQRLAAEVADWLQCENCRSWWHRTCAIAGSEGLNINTGVFYCTSCTQRILALGTGKRNAITPKKNSSENGVLEEEAKNDYDEEKELEFVEN